MPEMNPTTPATEVTTPASEAPAPAAPKAPKPKAKPAAKAKPTPKKAAPTKKPAAAKAKPTTSDDPKTKPIRWSNKKIALLATLSKLGATNSDSAVTPEKINSASKGKALTTLNPAFDLTQQGYIGAAKHEGQTGLCWYITSKGRTVLNKQST